MRKSIILLLAAFAFALTACGNVGPFTAGPCTAEEAPLPTAAPEFGVKECFSPEEMEHGLQFVDYSHGYAGFQIYLPADWYYEIAEYDSGSGEFGIDFCPAGSGDGKLRLRCYGGSFGVCGTGLVEAEGELTGTGGLRAGYYDGRETPSFIAFYDSPAGWVLTNELGSGWAAHEEEIEKILGSLVLDAGVIRIAEAEEAALAVLDAYHDYLRTDFDAESGELTVSFARYGGEPTGEVRMDKEGNIIE